MSISAIPVRVSHRRTLVRALLGLWLLLPWALLPSGVAKAQEADEPSPGNPVQRAGTAAMRYGGGSWSLPFSLTARGPLVALAPVARVLEANLEVGPLGASHALVFDDARLLIGPGTMTVVAAGLDGRQEMLRLSQPTLSASGGLQVPVDFLRQAFGDRLGLDFFWNSGELQLNIIKRQERQLDAFLNLVRLPRVSILELELSEVPRFRTERGEGFLEVRFIGDRLRLTSPEPRSDDPLIEDLVLSPDRLRILLGPGAAAAEPRVLRSPSPRLILEIFRDSVSATSQGNQTPEVNLDQPGLRTLVIDPGHGGSETGAIGTSGTAEKDLNLVFARNLKREIQARLPIRVVLTREDDTDLPLDTRTAIANQNKADLFISLHFNSSFGPSAHGAETYFLSREASDKMAAKAAEVENRYSEGKGGASQDLQLILWDLAQSYHLAESQRFANLVQEELNLTLDLRNRGVKQAPFRVLMGAQMPAVLVELGFLSNPKEESRLQKASYRQELVNALVRAISRFRTQLMATETTAEEESL